MEQFLPCVQNHSGSNRNIKGLENSVGAQLYTRSLDTPGIQYVHNKPETVLRLMRFCAGMREQMFGPRQTHLRLLRDSRTVIDRSSSACRRPVNIPAEQTAQNAAARSQAVGVDDHGYAIGLFSFRIVSLPHQFSGRFAIKRHDEPVSDFLALARVPDP